MSQQEAAAYLTKALELQSAGKYAEAIGAYDHALAVQPGNAGAHNNRGNCFHKLGRFKDALAAYDQAIAHQPDLADAHNNRGNVLRRMRCYDDALASYDRAIALKPDFAHAHYNRGFSLNEMRRHDEALASYDRAIALRPDYADAQWSKGFVKLLMGDFAGGWPLYEWRRKRADYATSQRRFTQPEWRGEDLQGKTILLYAEQGWGDTIHFCRYAKLAAVRGAKVILEVQPQLKTLMHSLDGVEQVIARGEPLPAFDYHCPLLSLPLLFKTDARTIPAEIPYLKAPENLVAQWAKQLGQRQRPRIGLVWAGNASQKNDHNRSMLLIDMLPLLANPNFEFFTLQKDIWPADQAVLSATPQIKNIGPTLGDFAHTAALMMHMDLVISVDTSAAHLAGALGRPVWILVSYIACWRWLLDRTDSPWYPTARLFVQPAPGDWRSVTDRVGAELRNLDLPKGRP